MGLELLNLSGDAPKEEIVAEIVSLLQDEFNYELYEVNDTKPWGAYFRVGNDQADRFIAQFFPGLDPKEARMGREDMELSPKFLLVSPEQRLSWQYHDRRAERWHCLAGTGGYYKSTTDEEGDMVTFKRGDVVQFTQGERHRLVGGKEDYLLVAEIWQHTDPEQPSDEADIVRLQDDYSR